MLLIRYLNAYHVYLKCYAQPTHSCIHVSLQQALALHQSPIVNISGDLEPILQNICDLVFLWDLVTEVDNGSALHELLSQNVQESCDWVSMSVTR